ncbi:16S rRNA (cytidine1402-2'-O)-methyltransferase [Sulfuritortus calidifontis]|uniref:Ribosomal RNA small subunit methyltransferase I n=1 Tax=Sulfuritortus calidifontis TaxID=1914471 RepID=A0A4R3JTZ1_9PROT|nr:16S rRNA (cytidine(1402)-2'-O)-methyltransferase [Sulfuritortus calidifontis]TCS71046.1 16S rRNA (cytidine1402-2'-O)-methyltransferase [Sulfuritortus calidifontis]
MQDAAAAPGSLYIVGTPIGNLRDITLRALDILKTVDLVAAEDTRVTQTLLNAHGLQKKLVALHEHNEREVTERLIADLAAGRSVAYVSDAGTPGVSDPGAHLARRARAAGLPVFAIPGPSAVATALSVAGIGDGRWLFYGFLPNKAAARRKALETLKALPYALVFYEAPHRVRECVADLAAVLGPEREIAIARELTKLFEQVHLCRLEEAEAWLAADANHCRGEFVLIVQGAAAQAADAGALRATLEILLAELPLKQAVALAVKLTGEKKNTVYELALELQKHGHPDAHPA